MRLANICWAMLQPGCYQFINKIISPVTTLVNARLNSRSTICLHYKNDEHPLAVVPKKYSDMRQTNARNRANTRIQLLHSTIKPICGQRHGQKLKPRRTATVNPHKLTLWAAMYIWIGWKEGGWHSYSSHIKSLHQLKSGWNEMRIPISITVSAAKRE